MAEPDIVQNIIIKVEGGIEASNAFKLTAEEAEKAAIAIADLVQKSQGAASQFSEFAKVGDTFASATKSISQLGDTSTEAFATLAEMAKTFGVSVNDIRNVEGAINALEARTKSSSFTYQQLAENYDRARGALVEVTEATGAAVQSTDALTEAAQGAGDALAKAGEQGADAADGLGGLGEITEEQTKQLVALAEALDGTLDAMAHLAAALNTIAIGLNRLGPAGRAAATGLRTVSGLLSIIDTSAGGLPKAVDALAEGLRHLGPTGEIAANGLRRITESMTEVMVRGQGVYGLFTRIGMAIRVGFTEALATATAVLGPWGVAIAGAIVGLGLLAAAIVLVAIPLYQMAKAAAEATLELDRLARASRQSIDTVKLTQDAFADMGIGAEEFGRIYKSVADMVRQESPRMGDAIADSADNARQATMRALEAEIKYRETKAQRFVIGQDFEESNIQKTIDARRTLLKLQETQPERDMLSAQRDAAIALANNLEDVAKKFRDIQQGVKGVSFEPLTTFATKLEGVKAALVDVAREGGNAQLALTDIIRNADEMDAIDIGKAFGMDEATVERVRVLGDYVEKLGNESRKAELGRLIPPEAVATAKALDASINQLGIEWERLKRAFLDSSFITTTQQVFGAMIMGVAESLKALREGIFGAGNDAAQAGEQTAAAADKAAEAQTKSGDAAADASQKTVSGAQDITKAYSDVAQKIFEISQATGKSVQDIMKEVQGIKPQISTAEMMQQLEDAARETVADIKAIFKIELEAPTMDFSQMVTAAEEAAAKIKSAFESIQIENMGGAQALDIDSATQALELLVQQVATIAQGITAAFQAVDFSELVTKINTVTSAFKEMEQAAYAASQAARSAAAAGGGEGNGASAGSEFAYGGLFRGRSGTDTNLAWLTDMEFIMRPEAVRKYGVGFMNMINALEFPFGGFRNGGLVMPRINIPAFRAGGVNTSGGRGGGMVGRPLTLVLDGQRFPNLSGPVEVVDGLEKHATMKKASRVGRAPSWVK